MAEPKLFPYKSWMTWCRVTIFRFVMTSKHGVFVNDRKIEKETALVDGDEILIGQTTLLFTEKDFDDWESALSHFKKVGERMRPTHQD